MIEDVLKIPEECTIDLMRRAQLILNENWESVLQPLSSIGYGRAGAIRKTLKVVNGQLMGTSTLEQFDAKRCQYKGVITDQGTETKLRIVSCGRFHFSFLGVRVRPSAFLHLELLNQLGEGVLLLGITF